MLRIERRLQLEIDKINIDLYYNQISREKALKDNNLYVACNCLLVKAELERRKRLYQALLEVKE